ncbi:universal stress protein [Halopelagius longus]|uniref:Universal stress protein n=1 Tax=Halopelagius longus TaxID=1236180 RepID=A0A1H1C3H2_9EURY|nr:universal stress protein [Halopelagius longus]RDI71052.1 universal stress protein [Halopelagius longus]SDQ58758.1 Nucleotide-binding universal stress protein, UspA family [Halopelagius longus]
MYRTILVPTDGSDPADAALDRAIDLARTYDATLRILSVVDVGDVGMLSPESVPLDGVRSSLRARAERVVGDAAERAEEAGVRAETEVLIGIPHVEILDAAADAGADLVVMGTHGRTGLRRALIGSVTERVVRRCDAPVLTVREEE